MLPTLEIGDRLLVNRTSYGFSWPLSQTKHGGQPPRRGDLVVLRGAGLTSADGPQLLIKRVVGIPGDKVDFQQSTLQINGWAVPTCDAGPYVAMTGRLTVRGRLTVEFLGDSAYLTVRKPTEAPFNGYLVKPGEVFVLGDDRGISSDSRVWSEGHGTGVPVRALEGKATRVLFGALPEGRVDLSRLVEPPLQLKVRQPGLDMRVTDNRIRRCLENRPAVTWPPPPPPAGNCNCVMSCTSVCG